MRSVITLSGSINCPRKASQPLSRNWKNAIISRRFATDVRKTLRCPSLTTAALSYKVRCLNNLDAVTLAPRLHLQCNVSRRSAYFQNGGVNAKPILAQREYRLASHGHVVCQL